MVMRGCCCPIIPYQEIIGNYSNVSAVCEDVRIIPYQEIIGNYSKLFISKHFHNIIPYQEIIGNYSSTGGIDYSAELYHTKK